MMRRRHFLGLTAGMLTAWPLNASAQHVHRVAILTPSPTQWEPKILREALQGFGYREDTNLKIEIVSAENDLDRLPKLAEGLVAARPDVIVAVNTPGTRAAMAATSQIPIVSAIVADPVFLGIVSNLARPDANVTGVANMGTDLTSKRIELLKELAPSARRIALFMHPDEPIVALQIPGCRKIRVDARHRVPGVSDANRGGFAARLSSMPLGWNAQAVVRLVGQGFALGVDTGRLATEKGLPSMLLLKRDVEGGGLMSYFADHRELWRRVAAQVDRLLKGASPRDLPFELPTRFELAVNLKAAKLLGLDVPPSSLARADEVIE